MSIIPLLQKTQLASAQIRRMDSEQKATLIIHIAGLLRANISLIIAENAKDLALMPDGDSKKDRLLLTATRIEDIATSLIEVAALTDPTGQVVSERTLPNGLHQQKIMVAMGVVGVIYESRPNVTIDVAALCLRSGNACVLKGGKEAHFSNQCLVGLIHEALTAFNIPTDAVLLLPTDRKFVEELLTATRYVDLIIPRGSNGLIQYVRQNSLIPTIETGAGVCHTYVESTADLAKAQAIVINARVSRPSVCNSLDCLLVDEAIAAEFLPMLTADLNQWNVVVYADEKAYNILQKSDYQLLERAKEEDFGKEWLDFKLSIKTVASLDEALEHIQAYSSRHSEAILTEDKTIAEQFLMEVDAAAVYHNASTRFTDGGVFGLGAEIGISTQKLHARGPFALEKLVTEKWIMRGDGQVRW
jgi:glutamate-5-semialdehyde dehydrogenase